MSTRLYYTAPSNEIFNEVKKASIQLWETYDDSYGYSSKKINHVKRIENIQDNMMYIVAMFDHVNQGKLASILSEEARKEIRDRMIDGGNPIEFILF